MIKRIGMVYLMVFIFAGLSIAEDEKKGIEIGWQSVGGEIVAGYEIVAKTDDGKIVATGYVPQTEKPSIRLNLGNGKYVFSIRSVGTNTLNSDWQSIEYTKKNEEE